MKTGIALIFKFIVTFAAAWVSFVLFDQLALSIVFMIAIAATVLNYVIGDLLVLPDFGNAAASVIDGILSAIIAYFILLLTPMAFADYTSIILFAVLTAFCEIFFHIYLFSTHIVGPKSSEFSLSGRRRLNYNTETADELNPLDDTWRDHNEKGKTDQ